MRQSGFVVLSSEREPGPTGISAPVWNAAGELAGALTLTLPERRMKPQLTDAVREAMISSAGHTYSVAASTSNSVTPGPASGLPSTKADSTSTRGAMKRSMGMSPPCSKNRSSISGA
ncbi:hypothetical protein HHL10_24565 [Azohydromonas sp. G-1-1-14]|uniref:IclR-ED domain-containing protein n=1 Tax=Azohydromonas caseinilytica TaxID=2728836 RepID=A0A848FFE7_9BURK|nr:hypothetical protein [Azohydromonas caseinilytica]